MLSDILLQFNQNKESIIINKEIFKLPYKPDQYPVYFSTVDANDNKKFDIIKDSLKIKKIDHAFAKISKDLIDKFRVVSATAPDYKFIINSMLISNGFKYFELLSNQIYNIFNIFNNNLKCLHLFSRKTFCKKGNSKLDLNLIIYFR